MPEALNTRVILLEESMRRAFAAIESLTEKEKKLDKILARLWVRRRFLPALLLWGLKAVPVLLILIGAALWIWAPLQYSRAKIHPPPAATQELQRQLDELVKSREAIKDRLDAISQQATHVQWLLSIVLGVAGLFTLAQGLFAFFSAQNYVKQADEAVKKIEGLDAQVRSKYPMFSEIEEQRKTAFSWLAGHARRLKFDGNLYGALDSSKRQEIFALENFAAIQFLTSADSQTGVIECLRLLGRFYQDKFKNEKSAFRTDFERAQYYLTHAVQKSNRRDICALNDLASLMHWGDQDHAACELFEESLGVCPDQQRALYNLGTIFFDHTDVKKIEKARRYFEEAAQVKNWEKSPNGEMSSHVHYNLACTYSRLSGYETDAQKKENLLRLAVKALEKAAEEAAPPQPLVEEDLKSGDLSELGLNAAFSTEIDRIRESFEQGWAARTSRV